MLDPISPSPASGQKTSLPTSLAPAGNTDPLIQPVESRVVAKPHPWAPFAGEQIVLDLSSPFVFVGRFVEERNGFLVLEEVDAHDLRDTSTTRDQYVRQLRLHGINVNRRSAWVRLTEIVAISLLNDVVIE